MSLSSIRNSSRNIIAIRQIFEENNLEHNKKKFFETIIIQSLKNFFLTPLHMNKQYIASLQLLATTISDDTTPSTTFSYTQYPSAPSLDPVPL